MSTLDLLNLAAIDGAVEKFYYKKSWKDSAYKAAILAAAAYIASMVSGYILGMLPSSIVGMVPDFLLQALLVGAIYHVLERYVWKSSQSWKMNIAYGFVLSVIASMLNILELSGVAGYLGLSNNASSGSINVERGIIETNMDAGDLSSNIVG